MQYLAADSIIPVSGNPCFESVLVLRDDDTIEGIYKKNDLPDHTQEIQYYKGILCPGFVNTHCHLELSWSKGLIEERSGLDSFIRQLELYKKSVSSEYIQNCITEAENEMEQSGVVAIADISNSNETVVLKNNSRLYYHTFVEVFGSDAVYATTIYENALRLREQFKTNSPGSVSITPHATYSLSDELFSLISKNEPGNLISVHHQENVDENLFFKDGIGPIADRRVKFNPHLPPYQAPNKRPIENIMRFFNKEQRLLLVHNTSSELPDIKMAEHFFSNVFWCFCPNANLYIENKLPDINLFRAMKSKITLGTDSLASNHQLSILNEIYTIQRHFEEIPLTELIHWGTLNGAELLGLENVLGSFERAKKPGVVHIDNIDMHTLKLTRLSKSHLIKKA